MAKNKFVLPSIILTSGWGGEGDDTGHGSGGTTGGGDIMICDFDEWLEMYGDDYDGDDDIDRDDYQYWWFNIAGLSQEDWDELNP